MRVGAVNYLNSKPLIEGFHRLAPGADLRCDLPSRLADSLAEGRFDAALIPTFEVLANPAYRIVSDACVASDGAVSSVKVYFRTRPGECRTLALDEGSRTSAALSRVLLHRRFGVDPVREPLAIGAGLADSTADAVLLIGDRAMHEPPVEVARQFVEVWDLGEEWLRDTGLPFVFACWAARTELNTDVLAVQLSACRDLGEKRFAEIAASEAPLLGLTVEHAERYLRECLRFRLGPRERRSIAAFRSACLDAKLLEPFEPIAAG
ncbi:MAG: menaquinone biosynthesis protein [Planctomycetota bacterium]